MKQSNATFVERWNPYQTFTLQESELRSWYNHFGSWAFYDGKQWKPQFHILFGVNNPMVEVYFVQK